MFGFGCERRFERHGVPDRDNSVGEAAGNEPLLAGTAPSESIEAKGNEMTRIGNANGSKSE